METELVSWRQGGLVHKVVSLKNPSSANSFPDIPASCVKSVILQEGLYILPSSTHSNLIWKCPEMISHFNSVLLLLLA